MLELIEDRLFDVFSAVEPLLGARDRSDSRSIS